MTGTTPRTHGDRVYLDRLEMPNPAQFPTLAQTLRANGYQAGAVGKMHVYPQRDRIGFDDVVLNEEGRVQFGVVDDYELFLGDRGLPGRAFSHGVSNNLYDTAVWSLPDEYHPTEWTTDQMCRMMYRRDPKRPAFWYLSYMHPHPPLVPARDFLEMYNDTVFATPPMPDWADGGSQTPWPVLDRQFVMKETNDPVYTRRALAAFHALCTHIDRQIARILGVLNETGRDANTIIAFTSDHGDMLGSGGCWAKRLMYDRSSRIPFLLLGHRAAQDRVGMNQRDDQLVGLQDLMPTLLDLAGIPIPESCDGRSIFDGRPRDYLYGEVGENLTASRMIRRGPWKLIYYPTGNQRQLFHLADDPEECCDRSGDGDCAGILKELTDLLIAELYGEDESWLSEGRLVGVPKPDRMDERDHRRLSGQRGPHWPPPPPR